MNQKQPYVSQPAAHRADNIRWGIGFILLSSALFAFISADVKLMSGQVSTIEIVFFRQFFSCIAIGVLLTRQKAWPSLRTKRPFGHLFRGIIGNSSMIVLYASVALLPLADSTALSFATPLFITALSRPLLREPVGPHRWSAVVIGFAGVIIMTHPSGAWFNAGSGLGVSLALIGAFTSALMMITIRQLNRTEAPLAIVFYFTVIGCIVFGGMLPFYWSSPTPREWIGLVVVGLSGAGAQVAMTYAYRHAPASALAPFGYVAILWSTAFGYILWGDLPRDRIVIGAAVVIASGLYIIHRETRRNVAVKAESLPVA